MPSDFSNIKIPGAELEHCQMEFQSLKEANLSGCGFYRSRLSGSDFTDADMRNVYFVEAAALFTRFSAKTNLKDANMNFALLLGASYEGEPLTDDILNRKEAKNTETAITSIAKLEALLDSGKMDKKQLDFFKDQINQIHIGIYSYQQRKQRAMFLKPEWAVLAPFSTQENIQLLRQAYKLINDHLSATNNTAYQASMR